MVANTRLYASNYFHVYSESITTTVDLLTTTNGPADGRPCREIRIMSAGGGTLVVEKLDGTNETLTGCVAGDVYTTQCRKLIGTGSTVAGLRVNW